MPTGTVCHRNRPASFVLRAAAWSLGLFGFLRLGWVEDHCLLPLTLLQGRLGAGLCGAPTLPVTTTLACSGADALALCLGVILAYPARWGARLLGVAGGLALILFLNVLRIGTLGLAASSPGWFDALHLYLWPAALILAIAGYVFAWMRFSDLRGVGSAAQGGGCEGGRARPVRRFLLLAGIFLVLFVVAAPLYLESRLVLSVAALIARSAAALLRMAGLEAAASGNVLATSRGSFLITQECISTPLIPVYLAAVVAFSRRWGRGALGFLAAVPLFFVLGVARLLVVAFPEALVSSPIFLVHAFYQLVLGAVMVVLAAVWRHGPGRASLRRSLLGISLGLLFALLLGAPCARLVSRSAEMLGGLLFPVLSAGPVPDDPQGAVALLPPFQYGLYLALWAAAFVPLGWRRHAAGLAFLGVTQVVTLVLLRVLFDGAGVALHVREIRAVSIVGPLAVLVLVSLGREPGRRIPAAVPEAGPGRG